MRLAMWNSLSMTGESTLPVGARTRCIISECMLYILSLPIQYLNSGPGCVAGFFVHEKHAMKPELTRSVLFVHEREKERLSYPGCWVGGHTAETVA